MPDPTELDNAALAQLLDDEARFRPVYNGDMARVMREAAKRLKNEPEWSPGPYQRYRHYKGGLYEVIGGGVLEATQAHVLLYRAVGLSLVWVRPFDEFHGDISPNRKRFEIVSPIVPAPSQPAAQPELCSHCKRPVADADCPFDTCPAGIEF